MKTTVRGERSACKCVECKPPFAWKKADEMGTCCPLCRAECVQTPDDCSFANSLAGGVDFSGFHSAKDECEFEIDSRQEAS